MNIERNDFLRPEWKYAGAKANNRAKRAIHAGSSVKTGFHPSLFST
jgi:hypothetical protein